MANLLENISSKVSAIVELAKTLGNSELMLEISELQMRLADLKIEHAALKDENRELKAEPEEWKINPLRWNGSFYMDTNNHPFCPRCYDANKKRIRLPYSTSIFLVCPECLRKFDTRGEPHV